jgi:hypothetical protein
MTHVCCGGLGDEVEDLLRCPEKSIQQWWLIFSAVFPRVHHLYEFLGCCF